MTESTNTPHLALNSILAPFFAALILSIILILCFVFIGAYSMDKATLKSSVHLANTAISSIRRDVETTTFDKSYWDQAVENVVLKKNLIWADKNIGIYLFNKFGFSSSHVIDADNRLVYGMIGGRRNNADPFAYYPSGLEKLVEKTRAASPTEPPKPASGFVKINESISFVAASVLTNYSYVGGKKISKGTPSVIIVGKKFDSDFLAKLAEDYQLNALKLTLSTTKPVTASLPLTADDQTLLGYLTWQEETPGSELLKWIAPLVAGVFMIVGGLAYVFVRRTQVAANDFLHEVKERKRVEKELIQHQRMESLGNLAGGIAHNLNNLLVPILSLSEMSLRNIPHDSPEYENLTVIARAGQSAKELVEEVMAFSHRFEPKSEYLDIHSVIKSNMDLLRSSVPKAIKITEILDPNTGIIYGDAAQISSILINLASNAVDAIGSETGGIIINLAPETIDDSTSNSSITSAQLENGSYARLAITDTGHGMDMETLDRIFEPFYTTKDIGKGTGLGLSSVQGFVTNHNGAISVTSTPDIGSTFEVYIPLIERKSVH